MRGAWCQRENFLEVSSKASILSVELEEITDGKAKYRKIKNKPLGTEP